MVAGELLVGVGISCNLPIVSLAVVGGFALVPESKDPQATPLDPLGAVLSIAGLSALVFGIIEAPENGWTDGVTLSALATAVVLLTVFVAWELRCKHPMLRISFFKDPRFTAASVAITLVFFALFGTIFVLTQHLQFVLGYSALEAGFRVTPIATLVIGAPLAARAVERIGTKAVVTAGLMVVAIALWLISGVAVGSGYAPLAWALALMGLGMGATMAPATDSIMGSLPLAKAGVGSAMNDTTRMVGGALGVAVIGSVLSSSYGEAIAPAVSRLPPPVAAAASDSVGAALSVAGRIGPQASELVQAAHSAYVESMGDAVLVAAGVAFLGAMVALLFLPARPRAVESQSREVPPLESVPVR